ncbi:hypothetical protein [Limnoglobus roseus]|uniref:Uncharacterized protein n=1 Tax=Limnoglobus roseus TaxID=2598579 RepID=A0A5C1ALL7_9BACT|nr:hypothetical protein [Limnoglobus roseus]QEL18632.1 hypothetical protein PX52LOC_05665 [Limnoglobus roseus]
MPENRELPPRAKTLYSWQSKAGGAAVTTALAALGAWYNWPTSQSVILFLAIVSVGLCYVVYRGFPCPRCSRGMWKAKWPGDARGRAGYGAGSATSSGTQEPGWRRGKPRGPGTSSHARHRRDRARTSVLSETVSDRTSTPMPIIVAVVLLLAGVLFWFVPGRHRRVVK